MEDKKAMVIFQPSGRRGKVPKGISLIEASRLLGVDIEVLCGEKRVCGKCKVRIEEGHFEKAHPDARCFKMILVVLFEEGLPERCDQSLPQDRAPLGCVRPVVKPRLLRCHLGYWPSLPM